MRTKRFEWQVGPRLFSGQLQAFCATCLSSNISYLNKIGLRGSKQVYPMVLSAFRCARILFPNRLKRAKGINLDSFMCACLELTLWNEKLYRNKHHSSASTKAKYTITYKKSTVCITEGILHVKRELNANASTHNANKPCQNTLHTQFYRNSSSTNENSVIMHHAVASLYYLFLWNTLFPYFFKQKWML